MSVFLAMKKKKKERKQKRAMELTTTVEELMEMPTFKRFNSALDAILDIADDMDLTEMKGLFCFELYLVIFLIIFVILSSLSSLTVISLIVAPCVAACRVVSIYSWIFIRLLTL